MRNYYTHSIDLKKIEIRNDIKKNFVTALETIPYRGYEVEQLVDGRKIVITKPGGKSVYGHPKKEDFLVFIFNPAENCLWQISHGQILDDLCLKGKEDAKQTLKLIELLEKTLQGEEPNDFIEDIIGLGFQKGESPEALIKAYKWIWGQEDVNYPNGQGRLMSWKDIETLRNDLR